MEQQSQRNYVAILRIGSGSLLEGFPDVTIRIGLENEPSNIQAGGSLPSAPELLYLYQRWQALYVALYTWLGWRLRITFPSDRIEPTNVSEAGLREICEQIRLRFNEWLSSVQFAAIDRHLRTYLHPENTVRILIETDNFELRQFPWNLWDFWQDFPRAELALSTPKFNPPVHRDARSGPMRILAVLGNADRLQLDSDLAELQKLPDAELVLLQEPTCAQISDRLWKQEWDIFFFAGHSATTHQGKVGTLEIGQDRVLRMGDLEHALRHAIGRGLQLAIFNSCDGLGILGELESLGLHVPQLVVMREPIPDRVAHQFLGSFLQAFARGEPLHLAVREAREQLQVLEYITDDLDPLAQMLRSTALDAAAKNSAETFPCASWMPVIYTHPAVSPLIWPKRERPRQPSETQPQPETQPASSVPTRSPRRWMLAATLAVATIAGYFSLGSPIARGANNIAKYHHQKGDLFTARFFYRSATVLDFRFAPPHYNLGWLCEEMGDRSCAIRAYYRAAVRGLAEGYAQASRLQILDHNLDEALPGIRQCLDRAEYDGVRVSCLKNLGWVRFEQQKYERAERKLQDAGALAQQIPISSPHTACLLAQTQEVLGKEGNETFSWWFHTLQYANPNFPEQEQCIVMAQERLGRSPEHSQISNSP
ncbi:MAG: CHAT domain-containing protein [Cyanobacteriota bacterium]|nr:CHAT domain-containing protein [Cyanobacteriota bacterium]